MNGLGTNQTKIRAVWRALARLAPHCALAATAADVGFGLEGGVMFELPLVWLVSRVGA